MPVRLITSDTNLPVFQAVWPLLFLLLENDWVKVSVARKYPLDPALFIQAHDTIIQVFSALSKRGANIEREPLSSIPTCKYTHHRFIGRFVQQKLDLKIQLKTFACGLVSSLFTDVRVAFRS